MVWLAVGWGLRPLGAMAQRLKDRDPDNLAPLLLAMLVVDPPLLRALAPLYRGVGLPRMLLVWDRAHVGAASQWAPAQPCGLVRESAPERQLRWALRQIGNCPAPSFGQGPCTWCPLRGTLQPPSLPLSPRERCVFERLGRAAWATSASPTSWA